MAKRSSNLAKVLTDDFPHDITVTRFISYAVGILLNIVIIVYISQLESMGCVCAEANGWMPTFLIYALAFSVVMVPFTLFLRTRLDLMAKMWADGSLKALGVFVFVVGLVKAYAMLNYALDLYRCRCASDWRRILMLWEGVFSVLLYFALFALTAYVLVRYRRRGK